MSNQETLMNAGLKTKEAKILNLFFEEDKLFSRQIEHTLRIRQPEACISLGQFVKKGWINYKKIMPKGKGRPQQLYSLKVSKAKIINDLLAKIQGELKTIKKTISDLETLQKAWA